MKKIKSNFIFLSFSIEPIQLRVIRNRNKCVLTEYHYFLRKGHFFLRKEEIKFFRYRNQTYIWKFQQCAQIILPPSSYGGSTLIVGDRMNLHRIL